MAQKEKAQFSKPNSQLDLEHRLETGNKSFRELSTSDTFEAPDGDDGTGRDYRVEGNETDGYVGTDPMYQTYANETEAPGVAEEGPEAEVFAQFDEALHREPEAKDDDEDVEEGENDTPESTPGAAGSTPTKPAGS